MPLLGVNIDHVATLRQARGGIEPEPVEAAIIAENSGADGITVHLREDRRHIQDADLYGIKKIIKIPLNLEMACSNDIVSIALDVKPHMCTLVPEKRQEITTEGGLDAVGLYDTVSATVKALKDGGIKVSLFIEPDEVQIDAAAKMGAEYIEIHTGRYSLEKGQAMDMELNRIKNATAYALGKGLKVNAGHGLNYINTAPIASIPGISELNIGHSIISKSVFLGLDKAVAEMKKIISRALS
ncbi:MAG: pyridoxine 5'-phosphate synthase [Deferribacterales bacterium]|nr:pyridoxine 5'-phosphate synthase [Deferribacterales bacterium]